MKKAIVTFFMVTGTLLSFAESWNPYVNQGIVSPAPLLPWEFNGTGVLSFNVGNSGSDPLPLVLNQEMTLVITLSDGIPNNANPLLALGGTWLGYFNWSYNPAITTYTAIQNQVIPGSLPGNPAVGTITIQYKVTNNTPVSVASNGFNVNLQPPPYTNSFNSTDDDAVSSYTYVQAKDYGDAPLSYGEAVHEINVFKDVDEYYTNFIFLGDTIDPESANQSSPLANGDDNNQLDDEDGVTFPTLIQGTTVIIPVVVSAWDYNIGYLNGWIDWNGDGDFGDAGEKITPNFPSNGVAGTDYGKTTQTVNLTVTVPGNAIVSAPTFARFRIGNNGGSSGSNSWGEVEDYQVTILCAPPNVSAGPDKILTCTAPQVTLNGSSSTPGVTFQWTTLDGNIVSGGNTATPTVNAAGTYTLTVTNPVNGCTATDAAVVTVDTDVPNVSAGPDKILTCSVPQVTLNGSSSTPGVTFQWTTLDGNIVSGGNTATPTVNAAGNYTLTVTDPVNGCTATDAAVVTLNNAPPNVSAGPDKILTCSVTQVTLNGSSSTPGATFQWTTVDGNIVSGGNTATPTVNAAGTYTLTVTNPVNGCTAADAAVVTLNNTPPNVSAGPDKILTCSVTQVTLNGSSSTPGVTYLWSTVSGNIVSGGNTATPTVNAAGTYTLTVTNPVNGCTASDAAVVTVDANVPNVSAGPDKVLTCTVTQVILNGSSSTPGVTFQWTTVDGNIISGGNTATPTVNAAGNYTLTVTNPVNGCTATDAAVVTLNNTPPNVSAGPDKILTCSVTQVTLNGSSSTPGVTFQWTTVDGNIVSGGNTATPTVNAAGTYTLTVTNPVNGCTATDAAIVTLNNTPPNVNAGSDKVLTCLVTQVTLNGSSSTPGATFQWTTVDGNIVSGGNTATPTVNAAGTYTLTVTNPVNGCTATDAAVVTVDANVPNVNAGPDKVLTCLVTQVTLNGSSSTPGVTFQWTTVDGNIVSGGNTATPTVNAAGNYTLTVTNPVNGCTASDAAVVTVDANVPNVNAGPDKILTCTVTQVTLNGSSSTPGVTFQWTTVDGNIVSGGNTATPTVNAAGNYTLTVTNPVNGCTAIDAAVVTLNNTPPNVSAGPDKILTCAATQVILNGSSSTPGVTFQWTTVDGNIVSGGNTATPTVNAAGTYTLTVTNPVNGCTATDAALVTIDVNLPNVNAGPDKVLTCLVTQVTLNGSSSTPGVTFQWTTVDGNIVSGDNTATPTVNAAGTYTLTVTNPVNGCTATDIAVVTITADIPNVNAGSDKVLTCIVTSVILDGSSSTPGVIFQWTTVDGNIVSGGNTATPTVNAVGTYNLTVTNPVNGCTAIDAAVVTLDANVPNVSAGPDKVLTCTATQVTLNGSSSTPGVNFQWTTVDGNIVSGGNTATPTVNAAGTYTLTVTNPVNGCTAIDAAVVTLNNTPPNVSAGSDKILTCSVTQVTLNGSSTTPGVTFQWTTVDGNILSGANTPTPLVNAAGSYTLTVTDPNNGCTATDVAVVTLNADVPNVNAGSDKVLTCLLTQVILDGSSTTPGVTYQWTTVDGHIVSGANTATPLVNAAGSYTLMVTNPVNGCASTDEAVVTLDADVPNVNAGSDKILTCVVTQTNLNGSSTTPGVTYLWTTVDGNIVSGANTATPLVNAAGTYTLTVTDPVNGCTATDAAVVTLNITPPNVNAGPDKILTCTLTQVTLNGSSSTPGVTYLWSTIDGNIVSGGSTATPLVNAAGTYTLTVTNPVNGCTATDAAQVTLDADLPNVNAGSDKVLTCAITQVTLNGSSSTPGVTYLWTTVDGNIVSGGNTATPLVNTPGTYILTVTDPLNGCTATDAALVILNNTPPNVNAGPDKVLTCTITQVSLNGSSSTPGATFAWVAGSGGHIVSGANTATPTVDAAGTYTLTVTNPVNGCTATDVALVTLNNTPPNVSAGADKFLTCVVTQVILDGSSSTPGATFAWIAGGGGHIVSGANTATPTVDAAGTYTLTVTNPVNGCTAADVALVTLNNTPPNVSAGSDKILTCAVTSVILNGSSSTPGATFAWVAGGGGHIVSGANTATPTVDAAGTYTLTVTNPVNGCTATDVALVTLNNTPPNVSAGSDKVLTCVVTQVILDGSSSTPGATFAWIAGGSGHIVSGANTATPTVDAAGTYTLTVTNPVNGCTATDAAVVTVDSQAATAYAGVDAEICQSDGSFTLSLSEATNYSDLTWTSSGTGTFNDNHILHPAYTPSPADITAGSVTLTLTAAGIGSCDPASDQMILTITASPVVSAGLDDVVCQTDTYTLTGSSASHYSGLTWVTSGTGTFDNIHILHPVYTPSAADIAAGTVTLTLTATGNGSCDPVSDQMTLTITASPTVNAGTDGEVCQTNTYTLSSSSATHYSSLTWTTSGTGTFNNIHILHPVYTPSAADIAAGSVTLTLTAAGIGSCAPASDQMTLTITASPTASAGPDGVVCQTNTYMISSSSATHYSSLTWTTSGTGTFSDIHILHPIYTPSAADIALGQVTLTLTAYGNGSCGLASDMMILVITPAPTAFAGPDNETCATIPFTVTGATATNYSSLLWTENGLGSLTNANTLTPTYTPALNEFGTVKLKLTVYGNGSCAAVADSMLLYVAPLPVANAGPNGTTCKGTQYQVTGAQASNYNYVVWTTTGLGVLSGINTLTPIYTPAQNETGTVLLILTVYGSSSCPSVSDEMILTIHSSPVANAGADGVTCQSEPYTVQGAFASNYESVMWTHNGQGQLLNAGTLAPTYVPSANESGVVTLALTAYGLDPCPDAVDVMSLTISLPPVANAGPDDGVCEDEVFTLSQSSAENYESLLWTSSGSGSFNNSGILHPAYTPSNEDIADGVVTLTLHAYGLSGCDDAISSMTLTIYQKPLAFAGVDAVICQGGSYTIADSHAENYDGLLWTTNGPGSLAGATTLHPAYFPLPGETGSVTFTLLVYAKDGVCPDATDQMVLTITPVATVNAGPDAQQCGSTPYTLSGSGMTNAVSVLWSSSGTGTFNNPTQLHATYTPSSLDVQNGSVILTLTATAGSPCPAVSDQMVLTLALPATVDAGDNGIICEGSQFTMTTASAGNYSSLVWTTPDGLGTILNPQTLTPTYVPYPGETGTIHLRLTAAGFEPCPDVMDEMILTIVAGPTVEAGENITLCEGSPFTANALASQYSALLWTADGQGTLTGANTLMPTYLPAEGETGMVKLTLTVTGEAPCGSVSDYILVGYVPAARAFAGPDEEVCENTDFVDSLVYVEHVTEVEWTTTGAGTLYDANTLTPWYEPAPGETGEVLLILKAYAYDPCPYVMDTMVLIIHPAIQVSGLTDDAICQGDSYAVEKVTVENFTSITWTSSGTGQFDDPSSHHPTYTPSSGDIYNGFVILTATIEALAECEDKAVSMRLDILATPASNAGTDGAICQGETFTVLDATVGNNISILWTTNGDGTFNDATLLNPVYTPGIADVASGKVSLTLTAHGAGSCGDAADVLLLTIHPAPVADAGVDQQIESSTSTQLNGSASGGSGSYTYLWAPPGLLENPASRNPITKILSDTTQFTLTVIDKNTGCQSEDAMTVFTLIPNRPPVAIDDYDSTDVDIPVTIDISVNDNEPDNDDITYEFCGGPYRGTFVYNGDGTITYTPSASFVGVDSLCYRICDDRTPSLCDEAIVYIFIKEEDCFHIYNGITPNGDGFNDTWYIECIDQYPENEVIILNRWFDVVRELKNYDNTNVLWDGTNKDGEILPDGTYFYVIKLKYLGQEKVHTGWIFVHSNNE